MDDRYIVALLRTADSSSTVTRSRNLLHFDFADMLFSHSLLKIHSPILLASYKLDYSPSVCFFAVHCAVHR